MSTFTIRYREVPGDAERETVETIASHHRARVSWQANPRYARAYALVEECNADGAEALRSAVRATVFESAIIALAVFPSVSEALPMLIAALKGPGRPSGIRSCDGVDAGVIVEWDLDRTPADVVLGTIDVELRRFRSGRTNELLSPLPLSWWTRIAAAGLGAPQIAPDRVLEALLEQSSVVR